MHVNIRNMFYLIKYIPALGYRKTINNISKHLKNYLLLYYYIILLLYYLLYHILYYYIIF